MTVRSLFGLAVVPAAVSMVPLSPAQADTVYEYRVEHPTYGDIGTYTNVVKNLGDHAEVDTELHVAVKVLGVVVHRENGKRTEIWQGDRLMRFDGETDTNGTNTSVHGEAQGEQFVVKTPDGTITAPKRVHPSNPWRVQVLDTNVMMSTKTGRVDNVAVTDLGFQQVKFDGKEMRLKRFDIVGSARESVWFDDRGTPFAFQIIEDNTAIDFVLKVSPAGNAQN